MYDHSPQSDYDTDQDESIDEDDDSDRKYPYETAIRLAEFNRNPPSTVVEIVYSGGRGGVVSTSYWGLLWTVGECIFNSVVVDFVIALATILSAAMIFMGLKSLSNCPVEPNIPIYLAVEGGFGLVELMSVKWRRRRRRQVGSDEDSEVSPDIDDEDALCSRTSAAFVDVVLLTFLTAWLACGTVWMTRAVIEGRVHEGDILPQFAPTRADSTRWCSESVFMLALIHVAVSYTAILFVLLVVIGSCAFYACRLALYA